MSDETDQPQLLTLGRVTFGPSTTQTLTFLPGKRFIVTGTNEKGELIVQEDKSE